MTEKESDRNIIARKLQGFPTKLLMKGGFIIFSSSIKIKTLLLMAVSAAIFLACPYIFSAMDPVHVSTVHLLSAWAVIYVLGIIIVSDSLRRIIPNRCILALLMIWGAEKLVVCLADPATAEVIGGIIEDLISGLAIAGLALIVSVVTGKLLHKKTLGGGDIKLLLVLGLLLGFDKSFIMLFLACIFGLITALPVTGRGRNFPFGPAISIAAIIAFLS